VENDKLFFNFVTGKEPQELKKMIDQTYKEFTKQYKDQKVGWGENGCKEFLGAILLSNFDVSTTRYVLVGIDNVFSKNWGALDFSNYMDSVVKEVSKITYHTWSKVYRYLESEHGYW
jgi:hypothetical protein